MMHNSIILILFFCALIAVSASSSVFYPSSYILFGFLHFYKITPPIIIASVLVALFTGLFSRKIAHRNIPSWILYILPLTNGLLFFFFSSVFQWADSIYFIFDSVYANPLSNPVRQILSARILSAGRFLFISAGINDVAALQLISIICGIIFSYFILQTARILFKTTSEQLLFFVGVFTSYGTIAVFTGHIESYCVYYMFYSIFIWICAAYSKNRKLSIYVLLAYTLLFCAHVQAFVLLPSLLFAFLPSEKYYYYLKRILFSAVILFWGWNLIATLFSSQSVLKSFLVIDFFNLISLYALLFPLHLLFLKKPERTFDYFLHSHILLYTGGIILYRLNSYTFYSDWDCFGAMAIPIALSAACKFTVLITSRSSSASYYLACSAFFCTVILFQHSGINSQFLPPGTAFKIQNKSLLRRPGIPGLLLKIGGKAVKPLMNILSEQTVNSRYRTLLINSLQDLDQQCMQILLNNNIRTALWFLGKNPSEGVKAARNHLKIITDKQKKYMKQGNSIQALKMSVAYYEVEFFILSNGTNSTAEFSGRQALAFTHMQKKREFFSHILSEYEQTKNPAARIAVSHLLKLDYSSLMSRIIAEDTVSLFFNDPVFIESMESLRDTVRTDSDLYYIKHFDSDRTATDIVDILCEYQKFFEQK